MDHLLEVPLLNRAAELLPQFMGPQLDDRIVGHPLDRPVGSIERDRNFRGLEEQRREFVLKFVGVPLHGNPPKQGQDGPPDHQVSRTLPQIRRVPLLTFCRGCWKAQKLTCTLGAQSEGRMTPDSGTVG